ncbi:hypothetical protein [Modestobacter versicolor]|uniref:ABC-2 type transport system permease protein n=1 Tax=Modestobacter versicolor TaxID=429133 RepID=A0A323V3U1_9ACTN|nr:hypothetical protein [Modestobacter versicolor]MBB3674989.1 ABC-2 type transport system permease protein [Modestobacter versicolor]PZA19489.1 hypothetical protein DMO24_20480 [Modestobacter versicolor]
MTAGLSGAVRSEWVKLRSLRSTVACYAVIATVLVALYGLYLLLPEAGGYDSALTALLLAELLVAGTAVLAGAGEHSAGTARTTFTAVPRRARVLLARFVVHTGAVVALLVLAAAVGWSVAAVAAPDAVHGPAHPLVLRAALGTVLALGCVVVLGVAVGMLTRSPAAGLTTTFVLLVVPVVVVTAPEVTAYLPGRALQALVLPPAPPEAHLLPPWAAGLVLVAWAAGSAVLAGVVLRRRDV